MKLIQNKIASLFSSINSKKIFVLLCIVIIYFFALCPPTDPDMGWHLTDGKYLMEHGFHVAKTDIFSYTMPDFPLIMHEWMMDIIMYNIFTNGGLFILSAIIAIITTAAFIIASLGVSAKIEYKMIAAILGIIASVPILGVKAQMVSLLGLAIVVFVIFKFRKNQDTKSIYFFPLLFFLWVNMHGGFGVGLFFIGVFLALEYFKNILLWISRKLIKWGFFEKSSRWLQENSISGKSAWRLTMIFSASCLATLINPYGWRVYIEVVTTIFDKYAKSFIAEWFPVTIVNPMSSQFIIYLVLLGILLIVSRKKIDVTYLAIASVFLYLAFSSWRHLPLFMIISIPFWVSIVEYLVGKELSIVLNKKWFLACLFIAAASISWQKMQAVPVSYSVDKIAEVGSYPLGAVKFLKSDSKPGNIFNEYNWGGFLIWQYPEKKLYIDGRMPSWRHNGFSILEEFNETFKSGEGLEKTLKKYDVSQALVYNNVVNQLSFRNIGWQPVYQDNLAAVFERPEDF
jgi:hypothetical protein